MKKYTTLAFSVAILIRMDALYQHAHTAELEEHKQSSHSLSTLPIPNFSVESINEVPSSIRFENTELLATQNVEAPAHFKEGLKCELGIDGSMDKKRAFEFYKLAAELGHKEGQFKYGLFYSQGIGTSKDISLSFVYFKLAADQGHAEAQAICGKYYFDSISVTQNFLEGFRYTQLAANQGHAESQLNCGLCYHEGKGVSANISKAIKYFTLAAKNGNIKAQKLCEFFSIANSLMTDNQTVDMSVNDESLLLTEEKINHSSESHAMKRK